MNFTKHYSKIAKALITDCSIMDGVDLKPGMKVQQLSTDNAIWDTGADTTIVCKSILDELQVKPQGRVAILGIGSLLDSRLYTIHLGLPSGDLIHNLHVMAMDDDQTDYDVIIGMDVISLCDFAITTPNKKTKFTFERPSKRDIDFTKE